MNLLVFSLPPFHPLVVAQSLLLHSPHLYQRAQNITKAQLCHILLNTYTHIRNQRAEKRSTEIHSFFTYAQHQPPACHDSKLGFLHVGIWYGDSGAHISESVRAIGAMAGTLHIVVSMCECVSWATAHDLRWRHKLQMFRCLLSLRHPPCCILYISTSGYAGSTISKGKLTNVVF